MTSLVAWVGVDSRAPASIYLASDSRVSWGAGQTWDCGRKLFASKNYPDVLGYFGDVLFPSQILGQVIDLIDADLLFSPSESPLARYEKVAKIIKESFERLPGQQRRSFTIIYGTRESAGMQSRFHLSLLAWGSSATWSEECLVIPTESGVIRRFGSGGESIDKWYSRWSNTSETRTSRSVFAAFCDALHAGEDPFTGGAPQLVGIYRKGAGETFGIIYEDERYVHGLPILPGSQLGNLEAAPVGYGWRQGRPSQR